MNKVLVLIVSLFASCLSLNAFARTDEPKTARCLMSDLSSLETGAGIAEKSKWSKLYLAASSHRLQDGSTPMAIHVVDSQNQELVNFFVCTGSIVSTMVCRADGLDGEIQIKYAKRNTFNLKLQNLTLVSEDGEQPYAITPTKATPTEIIATKTNCPRPTYFD